jgi:REase_AHJR-like
MTTRSDTAIDRRRKQVASNYRKQGYHVRVPAASDAVPAFLFGCQPDLIAEKDGDQVVIEVKRSDALRQTNDLTELAERVAGVPGWRLEVVVLRSEDEGAEAPAANWLETMLGHRAAGAHAVHHCVYLVEVLDYLVRGIASNNRIRVRDKTVRRLAAELAYAGIIDQDLLDRIGSALAWRDALMHGNTATPSESAMAREIEQICRELQAQSQTVEA